MSNLTKKELPTLNKMAVITKAFQDEIEKLSPQELEEIISIAPQLDEFNCYWGIYWLRDAMIKFCGAKLQTI